MNEIMTVSTINDEVRRISTASKSSTDQSRRRRISASPSHFISSLSTQSPKNSAYLNAALSLRSLQRSTDYYLAAHRRAVNVLTSNSAFLIFAVLVV